MKEKEKDKALKELVARGVKVQTTITDHTLECMRYRRRGHVHHVTSYIHVPTMKKLAQAHDRIDKVKPYALLRNFGIRLDGIIHPVWELSEAVFGHGATGDYPTLWVSVCMEVAGLIEVRLASACLMDSGVDDSVDVPVAAGTHYFGYTDDHGYVIRLVLKMVDL